MMMMVDALSASLLAMLSAVLLDVLATSSEHNVLAVLDVFQRAKSERRDFELSQLGL